MSVKFISELVFLTASFNLEASFGDADKSPDDYARQMASRAKHGWIDRQGNKTSLSPVSNFTASLAGYGRISYSEIGTQGGATFSSLGDEDDYLVQGFLTML
jgi:hypothetical protein